MAVITRVPESSPSPSTIDGPLLAHLLGQATDWLARSEAAVNALNVFPVPDGDTGTNMLLTMHAARDAAVKSLTKNAASTAGEVTRAAAHGALMGARGNSGVILSQILAGLARALEGITQCDGPKLAQALVEGSNTAYRAVTRPVEGTILTVARVAGEAATALAAPQDRPGQAAPSPAEVLQRALRAAGRAVEQTQDQLPILRQAGVVDAGGEGYRILLEGMLLGLTGGTAASVGAISSFRPGNDAAEEVPAALGGGPGDASVTVAMGLSMADLGGVPQEEWGYCTQFLIRGDALNVERLRQDLLAFAESALVVGDETLVRVHGHTEDPGRLLTHAITFGRLQHISIEDMDAQHDEWLRGQVEIAGAADGGNAAASVPTAPADGLSGTASGPDAMQLATVAVAPGNGLRDVFLSLGAGAVVAGGQTMNPSANDLLEAARRTKAGTVLLLPNNSNVIMAARQAAMLATESGLQILVVPTRTVPQGIAAQLVFDSGSSVETLQAGMLEAAGAVRTVEVTRASRSVELDGVRVQEGDYIGLVDDKLVAASPESLAVLRQALASAGAEAAEVVTVYFGAEMDSATVDALVQELRVDFPSAEIQSLPGGQPYYDYIISVE